MSVDAPKHPAPYSSPILPVLASFLEPGWRVVDRFAGTGRIHELRDLVPGLHTFGVELEFEWACMSDFTWCGDAFHLIGENRYDAEVTSVTYGNRFADKHNPQERCRTCTGLGFVTESFVSEGSAGAMQSRCPKCKGAGKNTYVRRGYTHSLGRALSENNSGALQWGEEYRDFHRRWLESSYQLVSRRLVLNVSDHVRDKKRVPVTRWFRDTALEVGFTLTATRRVRTRRMKHGANREARVPTETVFCFDKEAP